jgi:periplasmic protein CpxP/Spy
MKDSSHPKRRIFQALAAVATLGLLSRAHAQPSRGTPSAGPRGDPSQMIERRIDHMIKAIDGTPEQKTKLTQLAQAAMTDLRPLREQHMAARKKGMELLAAANIDRNALEQLRGEQMRLAESISRRMLAHMADAAEVLTPAQRSKVAERMKSRGERGWGRGGQHDGHHGDGWFR